MVLMLGLMAVTLNVLTQLLMAHNIPAEGTAQKSLRRGTRPHPAAAEGEELQVHTGHAALRTTWAVSAAGCPVPQHPCRS